MKPVVAINTPCHESWETMNPEEKGRFCGQCCKTVVDFTNMSNKGISGYLKERTEQKICGRFKSEQVTELPKHRIRFSFNLQRFAAAVFLAFGSFLFASCGSTRHHTPDIMGDVAYVPDSTTTVNNLNPDTTHLKGNVKLIDSTQTGSIPVEPTEIYKLGEVEYVPNGGGCDGPDPAPEAPKE